MLFVGVQDNDLTGTRSSFNATISEALNATRLCRDVCWNWRRRRLRRVMFIGSSCEVNGVSDAAVDGFPAIDLSHDDLP
ncbi:MAG: hypothetical protein RIR33_377 [Pseudomonadota bacterium]